MTEKLDQKEPRLWTREGFREDDWTRIGSPDEAVPGERQIAPLEVWLALSGNERAGMGVHVAPGEALDALVDHLDEISLISLGFPAFSDGRSFSKAELLRSRHGYEGEIRASGDVLIDQIPHMLRTGFDSFEIVNETALRRLEEGRVGGLPVHYQPTSVRAAGERYSWRRVPG
ncbi:DUF934 domain-containing protein [Chelativorans sp. ZYF759]|uniref:DUF934 domain-containing protein n=1 Tax=Chelativorans sp. ZYF759 TaxID=2692213 RepID=UPI00145E62F6|nr:DUF934 domain-containing protein [Chelativorans sp. ZYF759]NMG39443.1 DUF934 domain-containing protein [Chelativorans sp. ZYF759]